MQSIAREAGALLMDFFHQQVKIEYKGDADLVTVADRKSEALILERIRKQFPTHDVMGEEGTRIESGSDYKWYVDPLDGTTNFAHGFPVFCVSLAVEYRGRRVAGVIYDPTRDEMFSRCGLMEFAEQAQRRLTCVMSPADGSMVSGSST